MISVLTMILNGDCTPVSKTPPFLNNDLFSGPDALSNFYIAYFVIKWILICIRQADISFFFSGFYVIIIFLRRCSIVASTRFTAELNFDTILQCSYLFSSMSSHQFYLFWYCAFTRYEFRLLLRLESLLGGWVV